jgi:sugar phosphate isomerase/epimerase
VSGSPGCSNAVCEGKKMGENRRRIMKLGVFTVLYGDVQLEVAMDRFAKAGLNAIEIGTGNYPGSSHCDVDNLLENNIRCKDYISKINDKGLEISALSCHGNPLHPNKKIAQEHHNVFRKTVFLAEKLGIQNVVNFSGCPGDTDNAEFPNWVTCPWPNDFSNVLKWQWDKKVIPYWKSEAKIAKDHGVRICFEMHPGFVVYNTETLLKIRQECGDNIGANFDPSHLFWQGIDPILSIRALGKAIFHVHAKDTRIYESNSKLNGVLDTKSYGQENIRSWIFRTVGYGHGEEFWKDFVSTLRICGYDGTLSIEHEDSLMSKDEGFYKAVDFLKDILLKESTGKMWWA